MGGGGGRGGGKFLDWPEGVFPRRAIEKKRIESKETIQGNKLQEPEDERKTPPDEQPKNQKTNHQPRPPKTVFRPQPIQTTPHTQKVEGGFLKTQKLTLEIKGSKEHFFMFLHVVNVPHEAP